MQVTDCAYRGGSLHRGESSPAARLDFRPGWKLIPSGVPCVLAAARVPCTRTGCGGVSLYSVRVSNLAWGERLGGLGKGKIAVTGPPASPCRSRPSRQTSAQTSVLSRQAARISMVMAAWIGRDGREFAAIPGGDPALIWRGEVRGNGFATSTRRGLRVLRDSSGQERPGCVRSYPVGDNGNRIVNSNPPRSRLRARTEPRCRVTARLTIARPTPNPGPP